MSEVHGRVDDYRTVAADGGERAGRSVRGDDATREDRSRRFGVEPEASRASLIDAIDRAEGGRTTILGVDAQARMRRIVAADDHVFQGHVGGDACGPEPDG